MFKCACIRVNATEYVCSCGARWCVRVWARPACGLGEGPRVGGVAVRAVLAQCSSECVRVCVRAWYACVIGCVCYRYIIC